MKGAVVIENCQRSQSYCVWWRRIGGADRFRHCVLADSIDDAVSRSRLEVSEALGRNASLWKMEEPEANITRANAPDVAHGRERLRQSPEWVGIIAFVLLFLGLVLLFYWKSRPPASAEPLAESAPFERVHCPARFIGW